MYVHINTHTDTHAHSQTAEYHRPVDPRCLWRSQGRHRRRTGTPLLGTSYLCTPQGQMRDRPSRYHHLVEPATQTRANKNQHIQQSHSRPKRGVPQTQPLRMQRRCHHCNKHGRHSTMYRTSFMAASTSAENGWDTNVCSSIARACPSVSIRDMRRRAITSTPPTPAPTPTPSPLSSPWSAVGTGAAVSAIVSAFRVPAAGNHRRVWEVRSSSSAKVDQTGNVSKLP